MSFFARLLGMQPHAAEVADHVQASIGAGHAPDPTRMGIASPWASGALAQVLWSDIFDPATPPPNSRAAAMAIPAVARARSLMVTAAARLPLVQMTGADPSPVQPRWLLATTNGLSPQHRTAATVDDLIFYGWSCWTGPRDPDGLPLSADRVPMDEWEIDPDSTTVLVRGTADHDAILIPGFHEGVLTFGRGAISDALGISAAVKDRIKSPVPPIHLRQVGGVPITDPDEIQAITRSWAAARQPGGSGVGFSNQHLEVIPLDTSHGDSLMIEARNAAALDLARVIGVSGSRIDATVDKASLNYETTTGRNVEFYDVDLALYTEPITARLSMDDWTAPESRVAFDTSQATALNPAPTGPALED